jgi:hypothetical protein
VLLELLDEAPSRWSGGHVSCRLVEALRTLRLLPTGGISKKSGCWPAYCYEFEDLLHQAEQGELERTQQQQNYIRMLPSYRDITRMELALYWPMQFLTSDLCLVRAVNWVAFAHSLDRDAGWVSRRFGGHPDAWRHNHDKGCSIIARSLRRERSPVF